MSTTPAWDDARIARGMTAQLAARRKRIAAGEVPLGWKVGFGAPAALTKFNLTGPLIGYLMQSGQISDGGTASLKGWTKPVAEPEVAVILGHDVSYGSDLATAAAAISALAPAIELADAHLPFEDIEAILKANIFQRHVILGVRDATRAGGDTAGLTGKVFRNGQEPTLVPAPEALTGNLVEIVRHVADVLGAFGERLSAGEIIITGSVTPPVFVEADDSSFGLVLNGIGGVAVNFSQ